jgi:hypothetical protein
MSVIVYDDADAVRNSSVSYVRIKKFAGNLTLIKARAGSQWMNRVEQADLNLDGRITLFLAGAGIMESTADTCSRAWAFARINAPVFSQPRLAKVLYSILRSDRNLLRRTPRRLNFGLE